MTTKKQIKAKKEPDIEVVGLHKELINRLKDNKIKTGTAVRFYVGRAVKKQMLADGLITEEEILIY
jgi:hypothetical protein